MFTKKRIQMTEGAPEKPTSAPRTRDASRPSLLYYKQDSNAQRKEDDRVPSEESDPSIVVRDGRADHMAKGWAEGQRRHSTHARETNAHDTSVKHPACIRARSCEAIGGNRNRAECASLQVGDILSILMRTGASPGHQASLRIYYQSRCEGKS